MDKALKILLLEDNRTDAKIIHRFLLDKKIVSDFKLALNKKSFIEALNQFEPEIILSDHSLAQFDSVDALAMTRQKFPNIPFILVTGAVSDEYAAFIIRQGADDYILKDRLTRLPTAIKAALKYHKLKKEKHEALEKVIQSEEKYRTIFLKSPLPKWIYDLKTLQFLEVNEAAIRLYGYTRNEFLKMTIKDIRPKKDVEKLLDDIVMIEESSGSRQGNWQHLKKNGELMIVETTAHSVEYDNRKARMVVVNNITERINAEEQKEFDRNNLSALINNTNDLMWSVDKDLKLITFNDAFNNIIKSTSGKPLKKGDKILSSQFTGDQLKRYREFYKRALSGETYTVIDHFVHPYEFWVEISFYPIRKEDKVIGTACFSRDITRRKKAEEDLRLSAIRLNEAQAVAHIGNWEIDLIKNIHSWSDEFYRIYGINKDKIKPSTELFLSFMHPEDAGFTQKKVQEAFDLLINSSFNFRFMRKDGRTRYGYTEWKFEFDKNKKPIRLYGILQDITIRREAEEEVKKLEAKLFEQQRKEQLTITATALEAQEKERNAIGIELHDNVNQILVGTRLMLSMIKNNPKETEELVNTSMEYLYGAIEENRKIAHALVAPDLESENLAEQLIKLAKQMLETAGMQTHVNISNFREELLNNERKIAVYRIAQEQCTNIVKYSKARSVNIDVSIEENFFKMVIADDGIGMEAGKKPTGIGLRNINARLSVFNGKINITTASGEGFALKILIPLDT